MSGFWRRFRPHFRVVYLTITLLVLIVFAPIIMKMTTTSAGDYLAHKEFADRMLATGSLNTPHFLLHLVMNCVRQLFRISLDAATITSLLLAYVATALVIGHKLLKEADRPYLSSYLCIALLVAAPIQLATFLDGHLYFGYIQSNVYHNPTIIMLKPLALFSFFYAARAISGNRQATNEFASLLACGLITVAAALTKPSLTICILPALVIYGFIRVMQHQPFDWKLLLFGFITPALLILAFQYWMTYSESQTAGVSPEKSSIIFAPLAVMQVYSPSWLQIKLLLSILFPLTVLLTHLKTITKDHRLLFAWLLFFVGASYSYLLAESGPRFRHGNFGWSGQITLFILFVQSAIFLVHSQQTMSEGSRIRTYCCHAVLFLHVVAGAVFYWTEYFSPEMYW